MTPYRTPTPPPKQPRYRVLATHPALGDSPVVLVRTRWLLVALWIMRCFVAALNIRQRAFGARLGSSLRGDVVSSLGEGAIVRDPRSPVL